MIVAITGCTSLIGIELLNVHLSRGDEILAIVRADSIKKDLLPTSQKITIIESDTSSYKTIMNRYKCDLFYHLAWSKTSINGRDDVTVQADNIKGSLDAVCLAQSWGSKKFVGAGSQAEFGLVSGAMSNEVVANPESAYGISKYAAGRLCRILCQQYNMQFNWARILSVYGENDRPNTLIMYLIDSFLNSRTPELTSCEQIWDYLYAPDAAKALLDIAIKGKDGKTYVVGSGHGRPLKEYVESVINHFGNSASVKFGSKPYPPHQPMELYADLSELTEDTGFTPSYSFDEGIERTVRYCKSNKCKK